MAKLDWRRAKTHGPRELKYDEGKELNTGEIVRHRPVDRMDAEAQAAERRWLKRMAEPPAAKASPAPKKQRQGSRAQGTNPRALGTNPRSQS